MSKVYFWSDLHLGHKSIVKFSGPMRGHVSSTEEHDEWIVNQWNSVVKKRDIVYVLGDVCFDINKMVLFNKMNGTKYLIMGNHDEFDIGVYLKYFKKVKGFIKHKGFWISHAPIHPDELRGKFNIHGHVHANTILDARYINVCPEHNSVPVLFDDLIEDRAQRELIMGNINNGKI